MDILFGLVLLLIGGNGIVQGSVILARRIGLSELMIGLTLVGFGTSTPELVTSVQAALVDSPAIAVGNAVGSNIANILIILGLAALIRPVHCSRQALMRDGSVMLISCMTCCAVCLYGLITLPIGLLFVVALISYIALTYFNERKASSASAMLHQDEGKQIITKNEPLWLAISMAIGGIAATIWGADMLVTGAIAFALDQGISETVVGLTIVAVGTSMPELITSLIASVKGRSDIAIGNVIGSNIYNIWGILGITALITPVSVPQEIIALDIWVMLGLTVLLLAFARTGHRISRAEGLVFIGLYVAYAGYLFHIQTS